MSAASDRRSSRPSASRAAHAWRRLGDPAALSERGWWAGLMLSLLTAAVGTAALVSQQLDISRVGTAVSDSGAYWTVAQYQIAHQLLKQELRAIAAGEPARQEVLRHRSAVLASKSGILTEPSELQRVLKTVPGYEDATRRLAAVQQRISATLDKVPFSQADAVKVLGELQSAGDEELIIQLANEVRQSEIAGKEVVLRSLMRRNYWVWAGFALCWTGLVLWLVYAVRSRRLYRAAANDRQRAVSAMEHALGSKRKFLSMVNHEVRSPLQNIVAAAELLALQNIAAKEPPPGSAAAIRRIRHAVTVLQGQLRDLLTIARGDADHLSTHAETFEFRELVHDVCADQEEAAHAKGLTFRVEMPADPVTVHADPIRIAQVLRNLVENAVRYTSAGRIDVRLEQADDSAMAASASQVQFVVQDTGPGLPATGWERLQGDSVPFESTDAGTGIGLFVIRDLLQQLGGRIEVQRLEPQGTKFVVSVPALRVEDADAAPVGVSPLSVLIVDDREDVLSALSDVVRRLGHICRAVSSSTDAQGLLASVHYGVVLIDLEMPGQDGLALATEVRQGRGLNRDSMLILISAAEFRSVGQQWPFDGFLQKPIDGQALGQLIGSRTPH